jgi:hypothetical protein
MQINLEHQSRTSILNINLEHQSRTSISNINLEHQSRTSISNINLELHSPIFLRTPPDLMSRHRYVRIHLEKHWLIISFRFESQTDSWKHILRPATAHPPPLPPLYRRDNVEATIQQGYTQEVRREEILGYLSRRKGGLEDIVKSAEPGQPNIKQRGDDGRDNTEGTTQQEQTQYQAREEILEYLEQMERCRDMGSGH